MQVLEIHEQPWLEVTVYGRSRFFQVVGVAIKSSLDFYLAWHSRDCLQRLFVPPARITELARLFPISRSILASRVVYWTC
jgi:hypothetical protein